MLDTFIKWATCISTVIATLRAGSRALYLQRNNGTMGVMDGPLIEFQKYSNDTDINLFDISRGFSFAVRIGLMKKLVKRKKEAKRVDVDVDVDLRDQMMIQLYGRVGNETLRGNSTEEIIDDDRSKISWIVKSRMRSLNSLQSLHQRSKLVIEPFLHLMDDFGAWLSAPSVGSWRRSRNLLLPNFFPVTRDDDNDDEDAIFDFRGERIVFDAERTASLLLKTPIANGSQKEVRANVTVYAPEAFADLRYRFGIDESEFARALAKDGNPFVSFQSNSKGAARAGGLFFFSRDGAYMIKTIKDAEADKLFEMLPEYYDHMSKYARRSLLTRFCGIYKVNYQYDSPKESSGVMSKVSKSKRNRESVEYTFVIMNSVFPAEGSTFISERFDLKGSTVGRECSKEEIEQKGPEAVLKDLDLAKEVYSTQISSGRAYIPTYGVHVGAKMKASLMSQLRRDVKFLVKCEVMDYSLLVGVVNMGKMKSAKNEMILNASDRSLPFVTNMMNSKMIQIFSFPIQTTIALPVYVTKRVTSCVKSILSSVLTLPLPYYGAGICGVDGGSLSVLPGYRRGERCVYYFGLIDFLQPWTIKKVLERDLKGLIGYDIKAISCVDPSEYGTRFLDFMNAHIT